MGKFLFESDGELVIAEGRNVSLMYYTSAGDLLMFGIQNSPETHPDKLIVNTYNWGSPSFVVESFVNEKRKSSYLKHLIASTDGQIILRELTKQERSELDEYKDMPRRSEYFLRSKLAIH